MKNKPSRAIDSIKLTHPVSLRRLNKQPYQSWHPLLLLFGHLVINNIYNKKITSEDARKIVRNVSECKWNHQTEKLKIIARQIGLRV